MDESQYRDIDLETVGLKVATLRRELDRSPDIDPGPR